MIQYFACSGSNKSISSGMARKKAVGCTLQSRPGSSVIGVDLKLRRALEAKTKLEQEKLRKLEEKNRKRKNGRKMQQRLQQIRGKRKRWTRETVRKNKSDWKKHRSSRRNLRNNFVLRRKKNRGSEL
ncbi:hypothetical protein SUGI_0280450 [Cryptomeria japonica]|nr:hypothetical protein SUGI_0280450 [Cryptomeria japonica]